MIKLKNCQNRSSWIILNEIQHVKIYLMDPNGFTIVKTCAKQKKKKCNWNIKININTNEAIITCDKNCQHRKSKKA